MDELKLRNISLKGFKSFSSDEGINLSLGDINILLGANGAGKSNFLSFFKMLAAMTERRFQNYIATSGTAELFLYYGVKKTKKIEISFSFEDEKDIVKYDIDLTYAIPDKLIIDQEAFSGIRSWEGLSVERRMINLLEPDLLDGRIPELVPFNQLLSNCKVFQFHDTTPESQMRLTSHIDNADYLQSNGGNLSAYLYWMKENNAVYYDRIVAYIREIMPQFGDFYFQPNAAGYVMLKWRDNTANDYIQLPQQISDGTLRFMALATLLLQPSDKMPSVIILDEPELGLHPSAISQLAEMVKQASQYAQIILATQSPQLADEFTPSQIIIVERDEEKASTTAHHLDEERLKEWIEQYSISELWDKNVLGGRP